MSLFNNSDQYEDFIEGNLTPHEEHSRILNEPNPEVKEELFLLKEINQRARKVSKYGVPAYLTESIFSEIQFATTVGTSFATNFLKFSLAVVSMVFFNTSHFQETLVRNFSSDYEIFSGELDLEAPKEINYPITYSKEIEKAEESIDKYSYKTQIFNISENSILNSSPKIQRLNNSDYENIDITPLPEPNKNKYSITLTQNNSSHYSNLATGEQVKPFGMLGIQFSTLLSEDLTFGVELRDDNFYMLTGADERDVIGWKNVLTYSAAFSYDIYEIEIFDKKIEATSYYSLGLNDIGLVNRLGIGTSLELNEFLNFNINYEYSRMDYFLDRSTVTFSDKDNIQLGIEYKF